MVDVLESWYQEIVTELIVEDQDWTDLDIDHTPERVTRMMRDELLSSYKPGALEDLKNNFTTFPSRGRQEMIVETNIPFFSTCAHHMLPFIGEAHVGYIPSKKIVGLSKIPRVIDFFGRMVQTQERMSGQVADFLMEELDASGVIVVLSADHLCMTIRGVKKPGVKTKMSAIRGVAKQATVRREFYDLIGLST